MSAVGRVGFFFFLLPRQASVLFAFGVNKAVLYCIAIFVSACGETATLYRPFMYRLIAFFYAFLCFWHCALERREEQSHEPEQKNRSSHPSTWHALDRYFRLISSALLPPLSHRFLAAQHSQSQTYIRALGTNRTHGCLSTSIAMQNDDEDQSTLFMFLLVR
jgi:hypothetical protein